jgi:NADH-quinone oxidoreductase subunit J
MVLAAGLILAAMLVRVGAQHGGMSIYFWAFSAIALLGATRVVTHPKPVYSALYFVLTVFATAGLFVLLWAEFMAVALVLIYAGAILVTYVFVIMLASDVGQRTGALAGVAEYDAVSREPVVASAVGFAMMGILLFVIFDKAEMIKTPGTTPQGTAAELGSYLFRNQLVNLELAGVILTLAMVGAIVIARRKVVHTETAGYRAEVLTSPATPIDDNPHSIPVYGTDNPRQKAYPET